LIKACARNIIKIRHPSLVTFHVDKRAKRSKGAIMKPKIVKAKSLKECSTTERCSIAENYSDDAVSIARARVKPGVTTVAHHLKEATEIYLVTRGRGKVNIGDLQPTEVATGDVVVIPAGTSQKITNLGKTDLVFYCICTPRFTSECYCNEEAEKKPP
jgi:mannose-6-phosphate isomerase-like protein (cupin superfamily)